MGKTFAAMVTPPDVAELLAELVAIPSVNPGPRDPQTPIEGEARVADFVADFWKRLGLPWVAQEALPGRPNIVASLHRPGKPTLMLQTHMDVVAPSGDATQAFVPRLTDGCLYGRGSCDAKASLAAMMSAVARAAAHPDRLSRSVVMAAVVDEEYRFRGVEALLREGWRADEVVVGEPTCLQVVRAHKGAMRWRLAVRGRAAHSSTPELGDNAIYKMARVVTALEDYAQDLSRRPADEDMGPPTLSVGVIRGGELPNIVPDYCEILLDRRLLPGESFDEVEAELRRVIQTAAAGAFPFELEGLLADPPLSDALNGSLAERARTAVEEVIGQGQVTVVRYGSDASKFAQAGMAAILLGPGDVAVAHSADEHVEIEQVRAAAEVYYRLMTRE